MIYAMNGERYPVSGIRYPVFGIWYPVNGAQIISNMTFGAGLGRAVRSSADR